MAPALCRDLGGPSGQLCAGNGGVPSGSCLALGGHLSPQGLAVGTYCCSQTPFLLSKFIRWGRLGAPGSGRSLRVGHSCLPVGLLFWSLFKQTCS